MATRMQQRRGTAAQWTASNPILNVGEIGFESDTNKFKIGDDNNHWADLPYFLDEDTIGTSLSGYLEDTLLGANNGVAQLNSIGKLVSTQIPNVDEITQDAINTALVAGTGLDKTYDDNGNTITLDIDSTVATLTGTQTLTNKTLTSPVVNTPTGITKSDVGLANVDDTTDANKPVSTATQTALDLKAPLASPTFTGTVTLPSGTVTSTMIADGTIADADINASAGIALSKLATDPLARANHTGSQAASTISDFSEAAQDAIGTILGTGLSYNDSAPGIGINNAALTDYLLDGVSGSSYGLIGTSQYLDIKTGNGYNKEIELDIAAVKTQLETDGFAKLAAPAFTGTATAVNLTISGDLTVNGTTTNLNSTSLVVEDKNVVLGDTATPTDTTADGGGITLKGATDKTFNWVDATDAWTSSEHINLASGKTLKYNGTDLVAAQSGNSGKYLTTDGTTTSWGTVSGYSAPTLGSTSIASGATVTTVAGLTKITSAAHVSLDASDYEQDIVLMNIMGAY